MPRKSWTVALRPRPGAEPRKITKIVSLGDGGFAILTPYHRAKRGYLAKIPMPIGAGPHPRRWSDAITFTAENRVKLSYHADGFAQFSGEANDTIISGIDATTGQPKGLGLRSNPLSQPTSRGPVAAITVWGFDDYEVDLNLGSGTILFEQDDIYYRQCSPQDANRWVLTIRVFPKNPSPPVRFRGESPFINVMSEGNLPLLYVVEWRLVDFDNSSVVLGLTLNGIIVAVPSEPESGWILAGPSEPGEEDKKRYQLMAVYPRPEGVMASDGTLDRHAKDNPKEG